MILDRLRQHAAVAPERVAFWFEGEALSYGSLEAASNQLAHGFRAAGIRPGERVVYVGKNTASFFLFWLGAMKAGAVAAPLNWRLAPPEIAAIISDSRARLALVGREFTGMALPALDISLSGDNESAALGDFYAGQSETPLEHKAQAGDAAIQLYTSGTTGLPKGVMLSHGNIIAALNAGARHDLGWNVWTTEDQAILAMPVAHIAGTAYGLISLFFGSTCHIQRQFDQDLTFDMFARHRITRLFLVPAALQMLARHPRAAAADFSALHEVSYGAAPMPLPLLRECMAVLRAPFVQFYGMTETTGTIVALAAADHEAALIDPARAGRLRAAGRALPWVELRVADLEGATVPAGTVGEILTRSAANMTGYWEKPQDTGRTIDAQGWLHTGDAGYMDSDGYVFIHDRIKDMIISGGENVYPAEVESVLAGHPAIAEAAVFGVPDAKWGERVKAVVVLHPNAQLEADDLIAWCRERIAGFKCPGSVDFAETLPRNAAGKLLKRSLRDQYWSGRSRPIN